MDTSIVNGGHIYFTPKNYTDEYGVSYTYEAARGPLYWQNIWWKRFGCRELHIPFKYRKSSTADNYTLIHVTELGYNDTTLNKETWRQKPYYHLIDTVVHRDSTLIVRLLPGEGKILKCEVLRSKYIEGYLDYSNQRKMVAYPDTQITRTQIPTDSSLYRYHAVYFKVIPGENRRGVYYRRSQPMPKAVKDEQIYWEPTEYLLSDSVIVRYPWGPYDTLKTYNCGYPSIVVRYDSISSSTKVYVVYACENFLISGLSDKLFICENIFNANADSLANDSVPVRIKYGRELAMAKCDTNSKIVRWSTPTINASYNGNYYAWSDSLTGIVTAFKTPDASEFINTQKDTLHWNSNPMLQIARHPSLNTYSRLLSGETDCALVWQEKNKDSSENYFNLHYSRLRLNSNGNLVHYVPKRKWTPTSRFFAKYNIDSNMVLLTNNELDSACGPFYYYKYMFPAIYRGVEIGDQCCNTDIKACHTERIVWQGTDEGDTLGLPYSNVIWMTGIQMKDTVNILGEWLPNVWDIDGLSSIRSTHKGLFQPDVAQGSMKLIGGSQYDNKGDSILVVNFTQVDSISQPSVNGTIWQVWSNYMGFFNDYQTLRGNYTNYQYARPIASKGYRPHLAALPIIKDDSIWTRNRRIFEVSNDENTSRIVSSLEWFYRKNDEDVLSYPFFGYVHDTSKTMFSYVYLQNEYGQTIRPFIKSYNQVNKAKVPIDTIFSDWFDIKDYNQMKFYGYNKGTQQISVIIERQKDNKKYLVTTPILGGKIIKHQYHLFNSGKNKFRLLFVKNTRNPIYREELIIGGLPDINDFQNNFNNRYGRTYEESQEQLIDLGDMPELRNENGLSLSIYPNPTDEKIFATAYLPLVTKGNRHNLIIRIFTSLGYEIFRQEARPGETLSIQTKDYPQGAYFIRAEEKTDDYTLDTLPAVMQGFVVKR